MSLLCKERCKDHSASDILNVLVVLEPKIIELPSPVSAIPPVIATDCLIKSRRFNLEPANANIFIPYQSMISLEANMAFGCFRK